MSYVEFIEDKKLVKAISFSTPNISHHTCAFDIIERFFGIYFAYKEVLKDYNKMHRDRTRILIEEGFLTDDLWKVWKWHLEKNLAEGR